MFIVSAKIKPKKAIAGILFFGVVLIALILVTAHFKQLAAPSAAAVTAASDAERTAYLAALGWEVEAAPMETLTFTLPDPLGESYQEYNKLQLDQGFDLSTYAGRDIKRYSYAVLNYPDRPQDVQADLYLCRDQIVAGDILCCGDNGFVSTLVYPG